MEIGVDSFAAALTETSIAVSQSDRMGDLLEEIEYADQVGLDVFGVGEHHRKEFLDSAPAVILAAAAARTQRIRLTSAVAVLSAADPARLFQEFATLDLISRGRAEMVVGRGTRRLRPLVPLYREARRRAGFSPDRLKVGVHSPGYVAAAAQQAADDFFPGYARAINTVGKERGWARMTRAQFDAQLTPNGALLVGTADEVAAKILRHSEALAGISRITFMMNGASLPHLKLMSAIDLIATRVAPVLRQELVSAA